MKSKNRGRELNQTELQILEAIKNGKDLLGENGVLTPLIKSALEAALEGEMSAHMQSRNLEDGSSNRRNGKSLKTVQSSSGEFQLATPRDRDGSFDPQIVKKRQTMLTKEVDNKILALYSLGMSYENISDHLQEIYGLEVSASTINAVTDELIPVITQWRTRPLEAVYPIIFLDGIYFKTREEGRVVTKVSYTVLGINQHGYKEILGFYLSESEGARFWLTVLTDLKERGVKDIFITCIDGLKELPKAIETVFPQTEIQLCIVHQIRHSLRYVASKNSKEFLADLKRVYQASSKEVGEYELGKLEEKWAELYPMVIDSWKNNWGLLSNFYQYPAEIRKLIYTTNAIEGVHRQIRKFTKTKGSFTSQNALVKLLYCACQNITKKWTMPLPNWAITISQLNIYFPNRLLNELTNN